MTVAGKSAHAAQRRRRRPRAPAAAALAAVAALAAACGGGAPAASHSPTVSAPSYTVNVVHNASYGAILTTGGGYTLYLLSSEAGGRFTCSTSACTAVWPRLTVAGPGTRIAVGPGIKGTLSTVAAPGGGTQVTYNGYPLYRYAGDGAPGQVNGEGIANFGGTWYVVNALATAPSTSAVVKPAAYYSVPPATSRTKTGGTMGTLTGGS